MTGSGTIMDYLAHGPAEVADGQVAAFKPGVPAEHDQGVKYQGPWEIFGDGFSEHTRRNALALAATGLPVHLRSLNQDNLKADTPEMIPVERVLRPLLRASIRQYAAEIYQVVPQDALLQFLTTHQHYLPGEMQVLNAHRAIYTVWERNRLTDVAKAALRRAGQAWVACRANAEMLEANGIDAAKIRVVPCPYFADDPHLALAGRTRQKGVPRFYHIGKWEPRKAQDRIVLAFLRAFRPGEAQLYLKVSSFASSVKIEGFPVDPMIAIHAALTDTAVLEMGWTVEDVRRGLFVITKRLPAPDLVRLHGVGDVYVSMSRGEGFDMPAQDAKLAGNLLLYTPSGGTQAFADPRCDVRVEATGFVPCHPFYRWSEGACYIDYDVDQAVEAMREAARRVIAGRSFDRPDMSWCAADVVGRQMLACVDELVAEGRKVATAYGEALKRAEAGGGSIATDESASTSEVTTGPKTFVAMRGVARDAAYGIARLNAIWLDLLRRHPLMGPIEVGTSGCGPTEPPDVAFVEVPTDAAYLRSLGAKKIVLLRYDDQPHDVCGYEAFEQGADAVVVVPTEYAYRTLGYRIPYRVVYKSLEAPDRVRLGGRIGKKVLYVGACRFVKDTPLAAKVAALAPDLQFVWRRADLGSTCDAPENVEVLDPPLNRDELWQDIGCVLVTSRYESFCLIAYEAACRGIPVVFQAELGSIAEWTGKWVNVVNDEGSLPYGFFSCATADMLARACRDALQIVAADSEIFDGMRRVAQGAHQTSLLQLDELLRSLVEGFY